MSDYNYGGTDEESAEIKKLKTDVVSEFPSPRYLLHLLNLRRIARGPGQFRELGEASQDIGDP